MKLVEIARALACELRGDGDVEVVDVAPIEDAPPGTLTFLVDRRLAAKLSTSRAAAVLLPLDAADVPLPSLRAAHPYLAFIAAVELFHPSPPRPAPAVHPTAVIAPTAELGPGAWIGPHVVVGERVRIGDRVVLHAGAVIGSDGFGYLPVADGIRKIPHLGTVVLEDEVEIGANATVDRAAFGATVVGRGTKIDNLVMVAHGCRIGPECLLAAQVGLAGSTTLGTRVMLGGQVGAAGHHTIGDGAQLAAKSGVRGDVPAHAIYAGYPAVDVRVWRRAVSALPHLPELLRRLRRVERILGLGTAE